MSRMVAVAIRFWGWSAGEPVVPWCCSLQQGSESCWFSGWTALHLNYPHYCQLHSTSEYFRFEYLHLQKGNEVVILDHREINLYRSLLAGFICMIPELQSDCSREIWIPLCQAEPTPGEVCVPVTGERVAMVISCLLKTFLNQPSHTVYNFPISQTEISLCPAHLIAAAQDLRAAWQESHSQLLALWLESYPQTGQALEAEHSRKGSLPSSACICHLASRWWSRNHCKIEILPEDEEESVVKGYFSVSTW